MKKSAFRLLSVFLVLALFVSSLGFVVAADDAEGAPLPTGTTPAVTPPLPGQGAEGVALVDNGDGTFTNPVDRSITSKSSTSGAGTGSGSGSSASTSSFKFLPSFISDSGLLSFWKNPSDSSVTGEYIKLLVLLMVILLIYAGLSYASFPESTIVRVFLALIVGFLATLMITTQEMVAALQSYTALGIALTLFFPILALVFVTFVVASKVDPLGIVVQRIAWVLYSVYLFIQTASLLIVKWYISNNDFKGPTLAIKGSVFGEQIFRFLFGSKFVESASTGGDNLVLFMLLVTSVIVFWVFVYKNEATTAWLSSERRKADIAAYQDRVQRANAKTTVDASETK